MIRVLEYTDGRVKNKLKLGIIKDNLKIKIRSMYVDGLIFFVGFCVFFVCSVLVLLKMHTIEKRKKQTNKNKYVNREQEQLFKSHRLSTKINLTI